jgi:xanthosine utilization system XapX-like protein
MSTYPTAPGQQQPYHYEPPPSNGLGVAGFVVSLSGLVVCLGLISPIGLLLSLIALTKAPRGFAIAGSVLGLLGTLMGALTVLMVTGVIGAGLFSSAFFGYSQTSFTIDNASYEIDAHFNNNNATLPDEATGNSLINTYPDEWGNALKYELVQNSTTDYTITSSGADAQFGTGDDITNFYTAYNWASPSVSEWEEEVDSEAIDAAFDLAAKKIVDSFPVGADLPTQQQIDEQVGEIYDAWMTQMRYRQSDNPPYYQLRSAGPDENWDTDDDITRTYYFAPAGETDGPL